MSGRSRPLAWLNAAISAGLARVPRIALARLPGMRCSSKNVTAVTPITTITAWPVRRIRYPVMSAGGFREVPLLRVDKAVDVGHEAAQVALDRIHGAGARLPEVGQLEPDLIGIGVERGLGVAGRGPGRRGDELVD